MQKRNLPSNWCFLKRFLKNPVSLRKKQHPSGQALTTELFCVFQVCEVSAESQVRYELETRFQQLQSRLAAVTLETEEVSRNIPTSCYSREIKKCYPGNKWPEWTKPTSLVLRSVKLWKPHSRPCWTTCVRATVTPPPTCPAAYRMSRSEETPPQNLPSPSGEPISRRLRPTTSRWAVAAGRRWGPLLYE